MNIDLGQFSVGRLCFGFYPLSWTFVRFSLTLISMSEYNLVTAKRDSLGTLFLKSDSLFYRVHIVLSGFHLGRRNVRHGLYLFSCTPAKALSDLSLQPGNPQSQQLLLFFLLIHSHH